MPIPRIEDLRPIRQSHGSGSKMWAEWCFVRVCFKHFQLRFVLMAIVLTTGAMLFMTLDEEKHSFFKSLFYTFALVFGEPPEDFPKHVVLQVLFFLVPILGLTIIIEGIVDFSLILRDRRRFERSWCNMLASSFNHHVVLVGLGRLGFRTFLTLRRLGHAVVVIERDPNNQFLEEVRRDGSPLLIGDARREALLEDANIRKARSIVLATDDDMANLEAALDARKINSEVRVVLRMFDQNMADKVRDGFNIQLAMSQSAMSAPTFATCAIAPSTVNSMIVGDELLAMQRWLVRKGGPFEGRTIADVMREHAITVVQHHRTPQKPTLCPPAETQLIAGDGLMLQGRVDVLEDLRDRALRALTSRAG